MQSKYMAEGLERATEDIQKSTHKQQGSRDLLELVKRLLQSR